MELGATVCTPSQSRLPGLSAARAVPGARGGPSRRAAGEPPPPCVRGRHRGRAGGRAPRPRAAGAARRGAAHGPLLGSAADVPGEPRAGRSRRRSAGAARPGSGAGGAGGARAPRHHLPPHPRRGLSRPPASRAAARSRALRVGRSRRAGGPAHVLPQPQGDRRRARERRCLSTWPAADGPAAAPAHARGRPRAPAPGRCCAGRTSTPSRPAARPNIPTCGRATTPSPKPRSCAR